MTSETQKDIDYLKKKLEATSDPKIAIKLTRQIESLEDSLIIYNLKGK